MYKVELRVHRHVHVTDGDDQQSNKQQGRHEGANNAAGDEHQDTTTVCGSHHLLLTNPLSARPLDGFWRIRESEAKERRVRWVWRAFRDRMDMWRSGWIIWASWRASAARSGLPSGWTPRI